MTRPRFWIASLAVFVLVHLWMWLLSGIGVRGYEAPAFGAWSWYLGQLAFSIMFVFIYSKGMSGAKGEGFRYGLYLGLLWYLPGFFMNWPSYGFGVTLWHAAAGIIGFIIYGMAACMIYNPPKSA